MRRSIVCTLAATLATLAGSVSAHAQVGTAFTYQGQVKAFGGLLQSPTDFQFTLWNAATGGAQVVPTVVSAVNVPVTDGLFTVPTVDFGVNPYTSDQAMWLEISVRYPAGAGPYTKLTTRQRLTATPFSLATRGINVNPAGDVAIGSAASAGLLRFARGGDGLTGAGFLGWASPTDNTTFRLVNASGGGILQMMFNTATVFNRTSDGTELMRLNNNGNVGIGTTTPTDRLHVKSGRLRVDQTDGVGGSGVIVMSNGTTDSYIYTAGGTGDLVLDTQSPADNVILAPSGGRIAIGNITPSEKLDVAGNIKIRTNDRLYFGAPGEDTDTFSLSRYQFAADQNVLELALGDNASSTGNDSFVINTRDTLGNGARNTIFQFNSSGIAQKAGGGTWAGLCDERSKNDIEPMTGTLDRLLQLKGHSYTYKPEFVENGRALPGTQIGLVAQEVETVFPDWVTTGADGLKVVTERSTTALMVEAMRDLRNEKDAEIKALQSRLEKLEAMLAAQGTK